ncbi:acyltransferase [Xylanibacter ruminicola]|nr:acyltransferase [Xylanibacter ruminicola]
MLQIVMWIVSKVYPYEFALYLKSIRDVLYTLWLKNRLKSLGNHSQICSACEIIGKNIVIGDNVRIEKDSVIESVQKYGNQCFNSRIHIGRKCHIGSYTHISAINGVYIGEGLLTGRRVLITDNSHGRFTKEDLLKAPEERDVVSKGQLVIENNVWICEGASIIGGIRIGEGSIVAANAVVTKDVPPYSLVAGVPAKVVKRIEMNN